MTDRIAIKTDPHDKSTIYVALKHQNYLYNSKNVVMKSNNEGMNWKDITGIISGEIRSIEIHPNDSDKLFVMSSDGIFMSDVAGLSWNKIFSNDAYCLKIVPSSSERMYVGGNAGVFFSDDEGENWTEINRGLDSIEIRALDLNRTNSYLYAGTFGGGVARIKSNFLYLPKKPKKLKALARAVGKVLLKWKDKSKNEDGFRIERRETGGDWLEMIVTGPNKRKYIDKDTERNTAYEYRICATNLVGDSAYSNWAKVKTK